MFLRPQAQQAAPDQGPGRQVERRRRFFRRQGGQRRFPLRGSKAAQVLPLQLEALCRRVDRLPCRFALQHEARAQDFMPRHHAVERPLQGVQVELPHQSESGADVVRGRGSLVELRQEPHALLRPRQRQQPATVHLHKGRLRRALRRLRRPAQAQHQ
ncbi:hypothetical protein ASD58_30075 [Duganella sp. Root1480D1]|nr:hypothetical protein ASD58_30075 [Duganella sp. Root1480D1]